MGFLDTLKEQATHHAGKAQDIGQKAAKQGQAKFADVQSKRKADGMFRDLGASVYAERTGKPGADPNVTDRLVDEIRSFEAQQAATAAQRQAEQQSSGMSSDYGNGSTTMMDDGTTGTGTGTSTGNGSW